MKPSRNMAISVNEAAARMNSLFNRKTALFALKFAVSCGLLIYLFSKVDFHFPRWDAASLALPAVSALLLALQPVIMGARWQKLLSVFGLPIRAFEAIRITWVSVFANQFLPSSVGGDVVRVLMSRGEGLSTVSVIVSTLFDRAFALLALFLLIALMSPFIADSEQRQLAALIGGAGATFGMAGLACVRIFTPRIQELMLRRASLARWERLLGYCYRLVSNGRAMMMVLAQSALVHVLSFAALVLIAVGFHVDVPLMDLSALSGLIVLAHILPISIAGWGVRDAAAVVLLTTAGVEASAALSISVLLGVAYAMASVPGAVLWLYRSARGA